MGDEGALNPRVPNAPGVAPADDPGEHSRQLRRHLQAPQAAPCAQITIHAFGEVRQFIEAQPVNFLALKTEDVLIVLEVVQQDF